MLNKTIPERVFQVKDASGRQYKVTRYAWMESEADEAASAQWRETWHLLMTENGGFLDPVGDGRYVIDGTGTVVEPIEGETAAQPA
ncbi:MAG: hypothetical protein KBC92_07905 [Giesbergeria sp.]|jgi:hypothetical protein|uniref:hypothetical protein n=1 Tax=Candidatus Skiveiella danica TaxID=3386177 RepID=UPI001B7397C2|nr:hypothetical protein [Betaproteobacteria bacterium]MBP6307965.1 hypothetical protein [Burkholderiaceae bacterium]MBP9784338.1 hypothetical protein [Giesbergeria sp.]